MATVFLLFLLSLLNAKRDIKINGWTMQSYQLPEEMIGEHSAGITSNGYIYLFGGLKLNPFTGIHKVARVPIRGTDNVFTEWEIIADMTVEDGFEQPWFVSTKGANLLSSETNDIFLICEDSMNGQIWKFDINTFTFEIISIMPIPLEDCCAISSNNQIYIFGGQDSEKVYNLTQIYDYTNDEWNIGEEIPISNGYGWQVCENVNDEYIYLLGGQNGGLNGDMTDGTVANKNGYKYDILNDEWIVIENVFEGIDEYANGVTFLGANYIPNTPFILLTGGETLSFGIATPRMFLNNMEMFNVDDDSIDLELDLPQLNVNRGGAAYAISTKQINKKKSEVMIYAIGGRQNEEEPLFTDTTEILKVRIKNEMNGIP